MERQKLIHFAFYRVASDEKNRDYRYERITKLMVFTLDPLSLPAKKSTVDPCDEIRPPTFGRTP